MRDGFIIHEKTMQMALMLEPEDRGYLLGCMTTYYHDGEVDMEAVKSVSMAVAVILVDAMERMDADAEAYERSIEQRRDAAKKRWEKNAEGVREDANGMREDATACDRNAEQCEVDAKNAVSVSVSVNKEKDIPKGISKKKAEPKHKHGDLGHVLLTDAEYERLISDYGSEKVQQAIAFFDSYIEEKQYKSHSHNLAMRRWVFDALDERKKPPGRSPTKKNSFDNFEARKYDYDELQRQLAGG